MENQDENVPVQLELFEEVESSFVYDDGLSSFEIYLGDVIDFLKTIPDKSVDMILTDPPYESLEKHRMIGSKKRLVNWFKVIPNSLFEDLFKEFHRILKKNTHLYVMCDQETMFAIKPVGEKVGFKFWKPVIWDKMSMGLGWHYRARYEMVLFFEKGKRKLTNMAQSDVVQVRKVFNRYPTEKPVDLLKVFIENSTLPGEVVLDPFMGSGSCGEACLTTGRRFIGNDISKASYGLSKRRLLDISDKLNATKPAPLSVPTTQDTGDNNET